MFWVMIIVIILLVGDHIRLQAKVDELELSANSAISLRKALQDIVDLDGVECNEWDAVERVMPRMVRIAKTALGRE